MKLDKTSEGSKKLRKFTKLFLIVVLVVAILGFVVLQFIDISEIKITFTEEQKNGSLGWLFRVIEDHGILAGIVVAVLLSFVLFGVLNETDSRRKLNTIIEEVEKK